ncbi:hypothetical protein QBC41DRAFT_388651 [Cercophora samala]|uniref:Uncharacterized protein n=1 Tax=Cercophora samala TaxID=330535 RepID=A0AA40DCX4_9PEZI|nr:hypothetical protein QBC41DRAFT_388651 [Cercophora samala]
MPPPFRSLDQSFLQPGGNALQGDYRQPVRWPGRQPHAANQPVRPLLPKQPGQEIAQETTQQPVQQKYRPSQPQQSTQPGYPEVPQQSGGYSQPPENQTRQEIKREANEENERYKREFEEARKQVLEQEAAWQLAPSFDERSRGAKDLYGKDRDRIERSKQQKPEQQRRHQQSHPRHHSSSYQHETSSTEPPPRVPTPPYTQHTESFDPMATVTTAMESLALTSTAGTAPINPGFGWYRNAGGGFEPSAALLQSTSQYAATSRHGGYLVSDQAPIQPPVQPPAAQQTWSSNEAYLTPSQGAFYSNPNLHLSFEQLAERNLGVEDDYDDDDDEDEDEDEEEEEEEEEEEQAVPTGDGGGGSRGKKRTEKSPTSPYQSKRGRKSGKGPKGSGFWGFGRRR